VDGSFGSDEGKELMEVMEERSGWKWLRKLVEGGGTLEKRRKGRWWSKQMDGMDGGKK
jgi:hypothetical protein